MSDASGAGEISRNARPLIAHVLYRLDVGGLENGLVNLLNWLPEDRYRHAVICLTEYTEFARRIRRSDVSLFALKKPPGNSVRMHGQLWRLFRELRPDIVHTRNLGSVEAQVPASLARVPVRIHSEHGRDIGDLDGSNRKNQWLRRLYSPFVHHYIALSQDLADYLAGPVGIDSDRITQLYNGVDTTKFQPRWVERVLPDVFSGQSCFLVGAVGRMQAVKDQLTLANAFIRALELMPEAKSRLRLAIIGDGPLRAEVVRRLESAGVSHLTWLPGSRNDVAEIMLSFDLFVLPSLAEGISNTILEAMASGLPTLATRVGGNAELIVDGETGALVPSADVDAMARAMLDYYRDPALARRQGAAARLRAVERFSLDAMVNGYARIYDKWLGNRK
ncbi:MAG TPA: TIGR03088 family PEP-CTERM/XrtA system glycosyltransferase [Burkholderiales bacterium]|nr:TIGR03088 family PEP-CTERM/XrtA system glycosyltransferase [Burkholderiales bacterium]